MGEQQQKTIFDFKNPQDLKQWNVINDTVMGGVSQSRMELCNRDHVCFTGTVSLDNFGGFCSSSSVPGQPYDLGAYEGIALRIKGDGKTYKATLKNDTAFTGFVYQYSFKTEKDAWIDVLAPFSEFIPVFRGQVQTGADKLNSQNIKAFGFIIADKQAGPFRLEIGSINAYKK